MGQKRSAIAVHFLSPLIARGFGMRNRSAVLAVELFCAALSLQPLLLFGQRSRERSRARSCVSASQGLEPPEQTFPPYCATGVEKFHLVLLKFSTQLTPPHAKGFNLLWHKGIPMYCEILYTSFAHAVQKYILLDPPL